MLSLILSDALQGVDVATRYPTLYRQLLTDPELRQAFLDSLALLEASRSQNLAPLPAAPTPDLGFLQTVKARLHLVWQVSKEELQNLLFPSGWRMAAGYRSGYGWLDDSYVTLLRSQVMVEQESLDILLEAALVSEASEVVNLALTVARQTQSEIVHPRPSWYATIEWGDYLATAPVNEQGQATFPAVPLSFILQQPSHTVAADLHLRLEPK